MIYLKQCKICNGQHTVEYGIMQCCCSSEHSPDLCCHCGHFHDGDTACLDQGKMCSDQRCCVRRWYWGN